ncbi:DNA polymerase zeta catalytic subunit isoform X2 [Anoplophora glabripennis]|uniref:DNA polymerase zeta catalytic subunit isoform X2 n=1 Tax=Anoplophora glabripennis TaxID=217634 RepID=UPI00087485BA|nr:DNA polymerase zeta catalytic subunit isoform X2 [Anoplophora glabripennis]
MNTYPIRIIILDSYMSTPTQGLDVMYSEFRGSAINQVPIIRLFGSTETGEKICLHIHGVFPYLYIPYDGTEDVNSLMYKMAITIDKAINISLNQGSSNAQHIYKISLVSGIPMYGYHNKKHQFFKIHLYNPLLIRRVSDLLMNETTLGKIYQPHETHLPFVLQFMIDYNLHGMSNLLLSEMKYRTDPNMMSSNISSELMLPATVKKMSVCEIEADALAEHILNRLEVASGNIGVNPGIAALWADEMQRRRNKGETSQIEHLLELKNTNLEPTKSHIVFKQALLERLAIISTDKNVTNQNLSMSVYPVETPENLDIKNASMIDSQTPSDLELSLNETLISPDVNDTSISGELDVTMDEEAQALLNILQNLEAKAKEDMEEDSILSQVVKESYEDKEFDLSMPLESVTTPRKIILEKEDSDDDLCNTTLIPQLDGECDNEIEVKLENYDELFVFNNVCDRRITRSFKKSLDDESKYIKKEQKLVKKALYVQLIRIDAVKKGRNMPLLSDHFDFESNADFPFTTINNHVKLEYANEVKREDAYQVKVENVEEDNTPAEDIAEESKSDVVKEILKMRQKRKYVRKWKTKTTKKTLAQIKSWEYQIKRARVRYQLVRMMKKIHDKEHKICIMLSENWNPIFRVIPGNNYRKSISQSTMGASEDTKINIISDIMLKTKNYIDPNLHLTLQYPTKETFLYVYNKNVYPEVTEVTEKFARIENEEILKKFIKIEFSKITDDNNNNKTDFKQEIKKELDLEETTQINKDGTNGVNNSVEILGNNDDAFSNNLYVLLKNSNNYMEDNISTENNTVRNCQNLVIKDITPQVDKQLNQIYFSREIIDADNDKHFYIFSSKYLTSVDDENLINEIKSQSLIQIVETIKLIKKELDKHISQLKQPIYNKYNTSTKDGCDKFKEGSSINNSGSKQAEDIKDTHVKPEKELKNKKLKKIYVHRNSNENKSNPECEENIVKNLCKSLYISSDINRNFKKKNVNTNSKLKKCVFLDGTVDSSSSSEDEIGTLKHKKPLIKKESTSNLFRYSALPITFCSSPGPKSQDYPSDKHLVSQNTKKNCETAETSINKGNTQPTVCDNAKRRLNFANTSLQTTFIEEKLVCSYSPFKKQQSLTWELKLDKTLKSHHLEVPEETSKCIDKDLISSENDNESKSNIISIIKNADEDINIKNTFAHSENSNNSGNESSTTLVDKECISNSSHSEVFSDCDSDEEGDRSFFRSPQIANKLNLLLTTAEKYDKDTNYNAREGTSKVLTPHSNISSQKSSEEITHSSGSSSFGLLTPYQHIAEEVCHLDTILEDDSSKKNVCKNNENELLDSDRLISAVDVNKRDNSSIILNPIKKAPTRDEISKSLDKYKIPFVKENVPFCSNTDDVTGSVEVGYNVLKIISKTSAHMPEFESQMDGINNFRKLTMNSMSSTLEWKKSNINNLALSFCKDRHCIIEPLKRPPSLTTVKNWIREKSKKVVTPEKKTEKIKVFIPLSPGNNGDDDDINMSLTISPCTPVNSQSINSQTVISSQTPKSSKTSSDSCQTLDVQNRKRKRETKQKLSQSLSLRKSLLVSQDKSNSNNSCQITGVSPNNTYAFDHSTENLQAARAVIEHQLLTLLVMELHIRTRGEYKPNPEYDSIRAIFYTVLNDVPANHPKAPKCKGVIAINSVPLSPSGLKIPILDGASVNCNVTYVDSEENLLKEFLKLIEYWDPDIFAGYEIQMLSWGYLIDRASILGINLKPLLSRIKEDKKYKDEGGQSELQITGRIVLDVWRLMRHEIALQSYTFESVIYHILHKRVPQYSFKDLSFWWDHRTTLYRHRTVHYYLFRVEMVLELFNKLDIIGRTSELARLFGIQFYEVLSRGSQFRVESMMLRLAKPLNFIPVSPSVQQRAFMKAPEYIPLILEPESKLYNDPVIVLDFQSLYPSIIIAYNYCFTTCLGKVECLGKNTSFQYGATQLKVSRKLLGKLLKRDLLNFSPCGVGFVKKEVRDGILPRMLREILDTRLMVKNSMKENKEDQLLQRVLHNRQLGLKLIANVTYGYTAANFSGRMPSVEVGDSVVSKERPFSEQ